MAKFGYFLSSLVGVVVGAGIIMGVDGQLPNLNSNTQKETPAVTTTTSATSKTQKQNTITVTTDVTKAVDMAINSVVGITNLQKGNGIFEQSSEEKETGTGSGIIYKKSGDKAYIVTNNHVVEGSDRLEVTLSNGKKIDAVLKGTDIWSDLAVVEVNAKDIGSASVAKLGNSDSVKIGEPVIAIGNPLGEEFSGSVTQGIISGKNRSIPIDIDEDGVNDWASEVLQTDAAINPGNSGGALVNINGEVIGINSMKIAQESVEGIGLSIPINYALTIIDDLEKDGKVSRPTMGVSLVDLEQVNNYDRTTTLHLPDSVVNGVVIGKVSPKSPAEKAGLKTYDVITELDGKQITSSSELRQYLYKKKKINDTLNVTVYRDGKKENIMLKLTKN